MNISIKKILCPVDFSETSEHALRYAVAFAQAYEADLIIMHVVEIPSAVYADISGVPILSTENVESFQEACREHLEALKRDMVQLYARVTTRLSMGIPFVTIIRLAREESVDLVVMGTHGRTGLAHALVGSVTEKLVRKAPCPVLTVRLPEHEFVMP